MSVTDAATGIWQGVEAMAKIKFGKVTETVVTRKEFPISKARRILKKETIAVIGYGVQGPAQALNMRDNGIGNIIVGQSKRFRTDWKRAVADGWKPGKDLFDIEEAAERGTIIKFLVSDAAMPKVWPLIEPRLEDGDALYFSHGFGITYQDQTGIVPPGNIDVILVAPKGSGTSVRRNFLSGAGINSSYAVEQDFTGRAEERVLAIGIAIGSGYLFRTTFKHEVYSDLTGERGILMGALAGVMEAQFNELRRRGHSPSEAFNETCEELTQSLIRLVDESGMEWMYANCSSTAQRGALDWAPKFKKAVAPLFRELYDRVKGGKETARVIRSLGRPDYQDKLHKELEKLGSKEIWTVGKAVRALRPAEKARKGAKTAKGTGGRAV